MNKKFLYIILTVVLLVILWFSVYFICLSIKPSNEGVSNEQLNELDNRDSIFYEAIILVNDNEFNLEELTKETLGDVVVIDVKVNDREVQGYITYSDTVDKNQVVLSDEDNYAQVIVSYKEVEDE